MYTVLVQTTQTMDRSNPGQGQTLDRSNLGQVKHCTGSNTGLPWTLSLYIISFKLLYFVYNTMNLYFCKVWVTSFDCDDQT